ncbi:pyridoxamine 5'-phosphate oxidase family protein [Mycoplasma struthionis]|uniref:pyridoxamine 5'-phosphate oxidase family protein n=1 Tax=Mycoplasma struthionis TaxID=538220 RepID=UPI001C9716AD|nr:pyridoxamine 5'-phosphate oxidase family protein [Mycoplasma struthionis]
MNEVVQFLKENPVQLLARVGRDGKAKNSPFMFSFEKDGKLWFCTNNTKDVYKDLQANPYVELSIFSKDFAWIRVSGKSNLWKQ